MLRITRDLRRLEARLARGLLRDANRLAQSVQSGASQTSFDRSEQLGDLRLGRVRPLGLRNEVDLAPVEALGHDLCAHAAFREAANGGLGCGVQSSVLGLRGLAPLDKLRPSFADEEDFRSSVQA